MVRRMPVKLPLVGKFSTGLIPMDGINKNTNHSTNHRLTGMEISVLKESSTVRLFQFIQQAMKERTFVLL